VIDQVLIIRDPAVSNSKVNVDCSFGSSRAWYQHSHLGAPERYTGIDARLRYCASLRLSRCIGTALTQGVVHIWSAKFCRDNKGPENRYIPLSSLYKPAKQLLAYVCAHAFHLSVAQTGFSRISDDRSDADSILAVGET